MRSIGNRLRVTAQLTDVATGYHVWSHRYDREVSDVFEIQDQISAAIRPHTPSRRKEKKRDGSA